MLPPLKLAYQDVEETLHEWIHETKRFEDKKSWPVGFHSPDYICLRLEESAKAILPPVRILSFKVKFDVDDERRVSPMVGSIQFHSSRIIEALENGTDVMLDHSKKAKVIEAWQDVCMSFDYFARSAAVELEDFRSENTGALDEILSYAVGSLEVLKSIAIKCRNRVSNLRNLED